MSLALPPRKLFIPSILVRQWRRNPAPSCRFRLAERIDELDAAAWDRLTAPSGFFMSRRYLRLLEATRPSHLEPRYGLVVRGGRAVAAIAAQRLETDSGGLAEPFRGPRLRLMVCGNVFSWGPHGVAFAPDQDPCEIWPVVLRALKTLDQATGPSRAHVLLLKDFPERHAAAPSLPLPSRPTEPDMVLELPASWRGFGDYLASLRTRYRRAALRVARQLEEADCRVEPLDELAPCARRLHDLYLQVHRAARVRLAAATASYLPGLASICRGDLRCTVIRRREEIVGFVTTIKDGDTAVGYHVGFDRRLGARTPLYVRLLHATVADALALGCRRLSLGRTALESKARLGARPRPLSVAWQGRGLLGWGLARRLDLRPEEVPERRPFSIIDS